MTLGNKFEFPLTHQSWYETMRMEFRSSFAGSPDCCGLGPWVASTWAPIRVVQPLMAL